MSVCTTLQAIALALILSVHDAMADETTPKTRVAGPPLSNPGHQTADLSDRWHLEGKGRVWIDDGKLALRDTGTGVVLWLRRDLPADMQLEFDLSFNNNRGIGVIFLAAQGKQGEDILNDLPARTGKYGEYTRGKINCYGISLHRFFPDGKHNPGSNIRKNSGFHLVNHVEPDPVKAANRTYRVRIEKTGTRLRLWVDDTIAHDWRDDGTHGPPLQGGKLGFRIRGHESCIMFLDNISTRTPDA